MEIGEFINAKRAELEAWGSHVISVVGSVAAGLLKVPAGCRVKDVTSARGKQLRKGYADPITEMTDLVGARFVVLTSNDLAPIQAAIEKESSWTHRQARDPIFEISKDPTSFGYQSYHYEVRPREALQLGGVKVSPEICCEVQVRTLLQHAYAELTHDSLYKPDQAVPSQAERLVARSMALMETTDELLCRALEAVHEANRPARDLAAAADELTHGHIPRNSEMLTRILTQEFGELVSPLAADELRNFVGSHAFVLERIHARAGRGIFDFPAAAVIGYWVASKLENATTNRWPLPGSRNDVTLMLADLGIGGPIH
jgi:ppGpp synthetase/RelA/SpoT-type nucleotidyltranferase